MSSFDAETPAPPASRWEDYIDVYFSPSELFARRAHDRALPALVTLIALGAIAYYVLFPANGIIMRASMPPEAAVPEAQRFITVMAYLGGIMVAITHLVAVLWAALLLWGIAHGVELRPSFRQALLIAAYAGFIYLLAQIAGGVLAMIYGEGLSPMRDLSFGVSRFVDPESLPRALPPLLRRIDLFVIWQAVVWAIGVRVILHASTAQAAITAVGAWLLFALPSVIGAALGIGQPPTG
ncbi:MAG TPA: YIP1 family protein [Longimicrobiales bacterium]|nr:YIP1 family protein [Longimicrobiales bacterium]